MLRSTLAGLRARAMRLALSSLAIAAGVGFVTGTLILGASMNRSFYDSFAAGARNVAAAVSPQGASGLRPGAADSPYLPVSALRAVRAVPGVAAADGRVVGPAALIGSNKKIILNNGEPGVGISVAADPALRGFAVVSGRVPRGPGEVAVDAATAAAEHYRVGQRVRIVSEAGRTLSFRLAGTISLGADHAVENDTVVALPAATALQVTGRRGYSQIVTAAAPGVTQAELATRLRAVPGLARDQVQTGSQLARSEATAAVHFTSQFTDAILIFALIALIVAAIVIFNTFTILAAQRRRELALLRCVGASRRQVFTGMLAEAALIGVAASAAGVVAGLGLGWGLERVFTAFGVPVPAGPLMLTWGTAGIAMLTGTAVTILAAVLPARAATMVAPVAALGGPEPRPGRRVGWWRIGTAVASASVGLGLTFLGLRHVDGSAGFVEIAAGGCVFFVAVLAVGPLIAPPVTTAVGWLPGRIGGVPARLASANARRNPHRVAATTAALTIGITLMTVFTVVASSAEASAGASIAQHYPFGFTVAPGQFGGDGGQPVPGSVVDALRRSPALDVVAPYYERTARVGAGAAAGGGGQQVVGALAPAGVAAISPPLVSGSLTALRPGTVAVDSQALRALGGRQGGTVVVRGGVLGPLRLRVVAVYRGENSPLPSVLLAAADYLRDFRPDGAQAVYVNQRRGAGAAAARAAVTAATAADPLLQVGTVADHRSQLTSRVNQILGLFSVLLGLAILIALLGITNTLTLSVLERTRESAVLRALGLTRSQLRGMLLAEALLMALLGGVLGVALGAGFGWAMVHGFITSAAGGVFSVPVARIALYVVIGAVASVAAAVLPARRAARASVVSALAQT
jgi:putative ABC transport system permease protein